MNISEVAKQTGLTAKNIRFYEEKQVASLPERGANGYRVYNPQQVAELHLIRRSRIVGFSLEEIKALLQLTRDPHRKSADVKARVMAKIEEVEEKIKELHEMKKTLKALAEDCPGDGGARCPIIEKLTS
ncbi:Cu(I)-responsive transcriptional regulator [Photobacterium lipolyticum]|uniref:HTH-type transcriptional regulator CueR n=1 Tax=Photobacterium lipolyticum TaxID=266810 RepID=A0A2T3N2U4_9GAMM|nr:Cu(I)-responsive transcriptional regulator [Photobacterium lipolyticum]PSW06686.1 Cu(I)-responsive transcriptional regulator [Photobacterium lipolyticum]